MHFKKISQTLNWLVRQFSEFEANVTSVERIKEYENTPHEVLSIYYLCLRNNMT